ncbi:MAG: alpha-N-acetylglucosaminidase TIM-barrel domain-containing protein [Parabacteroides merdae]
MQPSWCGFTGAAQLDPTDSLFTVIGRDFLEEEKKLYGAHGVYAADPFHESQPPVDTPEYLSAVGNSIHKLFNDFDPNSIWAMQAWSLREPIVKAVPKRESADPGPERSQEPAGKCLLGVSACCRKSA